MEKSETTKKCKICLACLSFGLIWLLAFAAEVMRVVDKVFTGHGLDYFTTMWGYQFNYIGVLVSFIAIAILFILSPIIYWIGSKEERSFKQKYGINDK